MTDEDLHAAISTADSRRANAVAYRAEFQGHLDGLRDILTLSRHRQVRLRAMQLCGVDGAADLALDNEMLVATLEDDVRRNSALVDRCEGNVDYWTRHIARMEALCALSTTAAA